jgi:hypothetical protein
LVKQACGVEAFEYSYDELIEIAMSNVSSVDDPTSQSRRQWKSFSKNGNWDDASLNLAMEAIEDGSKLQITS